MSPSLSQRTFFFGTRHPVPVDAFYTISYPFQLEVWAWTAATVAAVAAALLFLHW